MSLLVEIELINFRCINPDCATDIVQVEGVAANDGLPDGASASIEVRPDDSYCPDCEAEMIEVD